MIPLHRERTNISIFSSIVAYACQVEDSRLCDCKRSSLPLRGKMRLWGQPVNARVSQGRRTRQCEHLYNDCKAK